MIASLPMYDLAPQQAANDRFWRAIRAHLGQGPESLMREGDLWEHWLSPDLVLSQTCGYPYRARLHGKVTLVGTPDYGLPGCPAGHYNSVFVARADDPREGLKAFAGATFAYNEAMSQSGWAAPMQYLGDASIVMGDLLRTGGHRLSAMAVSEGRADLAALDALSWKLMCKSEDFTDTLKEIARTTPTPVLPYITALGRDAAACFAAIDAAIGDLTPEDRDCLSLKGIVRITPDAYLAVPTPPAPDEPEAGV